VARDLPLGAQDSSASARSRLASVGQLTIITTKSDSRYFGGLIDQLAGYPSIGRAAGCAPIFQQGVGRILLRQIENQKFGIVDLGRYRQVGLIRHGRTIARFLDSEGAETGLGG